MQKENLRRERSRSPEPQRESNRNRRQVDRQESNNTERKNPFAVRDPRRPTIDSKQSRLESDREKPSNRTDPDRGRKYGNHDRVTTKRHRDSESDERYEL